MPNAVEDLASKTGMSADQVSSSISELLPNLIDKFSPGGQIPGADQLSEVLKQIPGGDQLPACSAVSSAAASDLITDGCSVRYQGRPGFPGAPLAFSGPWRAQVAGSVHAWRSRMGRLTGTPGHPRR